MPAGGDAEGLLAAMGGGEDPLGGGDPMAGGDPLAGGAPPEMGGDPLAGGGDPMAGGAPPEMGGDPAAGGAPPEMGGMGNEQLLQQIAMALMEAGIDPAQFAALGNPQATKIASAVHNYRRSGRFAFEEAKKGSANRKVRDYMKGFVLELYSRSQR